MGAAALGTSGGQAPGIGLHYRRQTGIIPSAQN